MKKRSKADDWIEDYAYLLKGVVLMSLHKDPPKDYLEKDSEKPFVILIPGIFGTWASMKRLGDKISSLGYPVCAIKELGYNLFDIPSSSQKLREVVLRVSSLREKNKGIVMIAHSKGGLIAKYYLMKYEEEKDVLGVVAIATPFSGTKMAEVLPSDIKPLKELSSSSPIIKEMDKREDVNKKIISIIPEFDNHVWAEKGSFLSGAENIKVPIRGHHKVLFSEEVEKVVISSIKKLSSET